MNRLDRAAAEAARRTNGQGTQRACEGCGGGRVRLHRTSRVSSGEIRCDPCCECGGEGYYFQVRNLRPSFSTWDLLGEERPCCLNQ